MLSTNIQDVANLGWEFLPFWNEWMVKYNKHKVLVYRSIFGKWCVNVNDQYFYEKEFTPQMLECVAATAYADVFTQKRRDAAAAVLKTGEME